MAGTPLQIIVGLGNPGPEHLATRHNAGFWFVDALARKADVRFRSHARFHGEIARIEFGGRELQLLRPQTYMNRSGLAIRAMCDYLKVPAAEILVVHDELDLSPGVARLKLGGGAGGHNGLKDTITHVGPDFWRLRLGVGHPGDRSQVIDYVLRRAPAAEEDAILESIARSVDAVSMFLQQGSEKAMHWLHSQE